MARRSLRHRETEPGTPRKRKASGANGTLGEPYSPAPFLVNPTHRAPLGSPARVCIRCVRHASRAACPNGRSCERGRGGGRPPEVGTQVGTTRAFPAPLTHPVPASLSENGLLKR